MFLCRHRLYSALRASSRLSYWRRNTPVGAVGKIEQGQAVDLLLNERDAGQGGRPLMLGVHHHHGQVCGQ